MTEEQLESTRHRKGKITLWYEEHDKAISVVGGIVLAAFFVWSVAFILNMKDLQGYIDDAGGLHALRVLPYLVPQFVSLAVAPVIAFVYMTRRAFEKRQIPILIVSFIIALCIVGSQSLIQTGTFRTMFSNGFYTVHSLIAIITFTAFAFVVLRPIFYALLGKWSAANEWQAADTSAQMAADRQVQAASAQMAADADAQAAAADKQVEQSSSSDASGTSASLPLPKLPKPCFLNKPSEFFVVFGILIVAWLPYLVIFFPGSISYDMHYQLSQFTGGPVEWNNHHPVLSTMIYGAIFSLGDVIGGNNAGLFCLIIFQTLVLAAVLTVECAVIARLGAPRWVVFLSIGFFALYPLFASHAGNAVKDTLFSAVFALYFSVCILYIRDAKGFASSKAMMALLIVSAILCGILRNNGLYIVLLSLPFLVFFQEGAKARLKALVPLVLCIVMIPLLSTVTMAAVGAEKGSVREALSVPLMQSARYCIEHPDDMSDYEREVLDNLFDLDELESRYDPYLSDDIKNRFNNDASLLEYFQVWLAQGLRHPMTYLDAWGELTYGYWSVQPDPQYLPDRFYNHQQNSLKEVDWTSPLHFSFVGSYSFRQNVTWVMETVLHFPLVSWLMMGGTYTWTMLALMAFLIFARRPRYIILLLPCMILMLTDIFGPMNGLVRYFFGDICALPLMVWACVFFARNRLLPDRVS